MLKRKYDFDKLLLHTMQVLNNFLYRVEQRHCKMVDELVHLISAFLRSQVRLREILNTLYIPKSHTQYIYFLQLTK